MRIIRCSTEIEEATPMQAQVVDMYVCDMAAPSDTSEIKRLFERGINPETVFAMIGKSEGTGLVDDFGRELAHQSLRETLGEALGISRDEAGDRVAIVLSGGAFGVVTPHVTVVTRQFIDVDQQSTDERLSVGRAFSEPILGEDVGRMAQVEKVASAVRKAQLDAGIHTANQVHSVLVKGPSLSRLSVESARARGADVVTEDLPLSMSYANDGSALGVALALGEVPRENLSDAVIRKDWSLYSDVASTSSGGEKTRAEVLVFGNTTSSASNLRIGHGITRDLIDVNGIKQALRSAGLAFDCCPSPDDLARVVQVFAKLILPAEGTVRGHRITLMEDIDAAKSTKCVGGALIASVIGKTSIFMSGGERNSHQGPPDGSPVAAVVRV
jgi:cyanuric acid amidohydrolase